MIYKFKFEMYNDNNELIEALSEESGSNIWLLLDKFIRVVSKWAVRRGL